MKGIGALKLFTSRGVFKKFAAKHGLVYFGDVDAHDDEHTIVRGVTAMAGHTDKNYTVGTVDGRDVIFVERHGRVEHPTLPSADHVWLILQIDLKQSELPHIFIDSHHSKTFHSNLRIAHQKLTEVTDLVAKVGGKVVLAPASEIATVNRLFTDELIEHLSKFSAFDYELNGDQLYVYAQDASVHEPVLTDMLRIGLWLAGYFETAAINRAE